MRADRAAVALADRGFRFGDGVFETIRLIHGVPYLWGLHMARLTQGLQALQIIPPEIHWPEFAAAVIQKNKANEGFLRIAVSRGVGSRGYLPHPPGMPATWAIEYLPPLALPEAPFNLWLSAYAKIPPQCLPTQHKLAQGISSTLAALQAQQNGCDDALQLTVDGMISETSSANLFWIDQNVCYTPGLETGCLAGTTRDAVFRLCPLEIRVVSRPLSALAAVQAVFITNSRLGVFPVASIHPMGWNFNTHHHAVRELQQRFSREHAAMKTAKNPWEM